MSEKTLNVITIGALIVLFVVLIFFENLLLGAVLAIIAIALGLTYDKRQIRINEIAPIDWFEKYTELRTQMDQQNICWRHDKSLPIKQDQETFPFYGNPNIPSPEIFAWNCAKFGSEKYKTLTQSQKQMFAEIEAVIKKYIYL